MQGKVLFFENPKSAIYFCLCLLLAWGCVNVYSASFVYATAELDSTYHFVGRYVIFAAVSMLALWIVRKIGYKNLLHVDVQGIFFVIIIMSLGLVLFFGPEINAARRWLDFRFFHLQPSEFSKLFVIMVCSKFLGEHIRNGRRANIFHAPACYCIVAGMILSYLVYIEPDMGTAGIIMGLVGFMCFIGGVRWSQVILVMGPLLIGVVVAILVAPYRLSRVMMWLNPWQDPTGSGYQMVQSFIAIGSGCLTGMGWGAGTAKFYFLPELHTDFAFAIFCQENGFVGALGLMLVFFILGFALWNVARRAVDPVGSLLVSGICILIVGQAVANMAMVCGILPIIGVPLSFISYGGSSMFVTSLALGVALSVYDEECAHAEKMAKMVAAEENPQQRRNGLTVIQGGRR